jgi:large subunit ribosomal protein L23
MQARPRPKRYRRKLAAPGKSGTPGFELRPHQVLIKPLVTEKGTDQKEFHNAYCFKVNVNATKEQIKEAVEILFNVRVTQVRTMIRHGKKRRWRNIEGQTADWKKAVVTLNIEDKIEFY